MASAKEIVVRPIGRRIADPFIKRTHYSGKIVQNSQVSIGVYLHGRLEGVMQFGPSMDKRKILGLVEGTAWEGFLELNRLAFTDRLPRNSESRALGIVFRQFRKHRPSLEWIVSFADATLCGDGTIYRAAGFVLSAINKNKANYRLPFPEDIDSRSLRAAGVTAAEIKHLQLWIESLTVAKGSFCHVLTIKSGGLPTRKQAQLHQMTLEDRPPTRPAQLHKMTLEGHPPSAKTLTGPVKHIMRKVSHGASSASRLFKLMGAVPAEGFQLRYLYFLNPAARDRLTVPTVPFSQIGEMGATMYRGERAPVV